MPLLKDGTDIDHGVRLRTRRREALDRRRVRLEKLAKLAEGGASARRVMAVGEDVNSPGAVGPCDVAEVNRFGVRQSDNRGRVKAHSDREALCEVLERRF